MISAIYAAGTATNLVPENLPVRSYFIDSKQRLAAVASILILLVSGTTYASALSLPGDPLYGMKIHIIEPIELAFQFDEESKNEYRISLLQKRLTELEKLREEGRLDENAQQASFEAVRKNVQEIEWGTPLDESDRNIEVTKKMELYNALIGAELNIEASIDLLEGDSGTGAVQGDTLKDETPRVDDTATSSSRETQGVDIDTGDGVRDALPLPVNSESGVRVEIPGL